MQLIEILNPVKFIKLSLLGSKEDNILINPFHIESVEKMSDGILIKTSRGEEYHVKGDINSFYMTFTPELGDVGTGSR